MSSYTNRQVAEQIARMIEKAQTQDKTSFSNGTISYNGQSFTIPTVNSLKRKTYLTNR
jgi:hypothetical protein